MGDTDNFGVDTHFILILLKSTVDGTYNYTRKILSVHNTLKYLSKKKKMFNKM